MKSLHELPRQTSKKREHLLSYIICFIQEKMIKHRKTLPKKWDFKFYQIRIRESNINAQGRIFMFHGLRKVFSKV